MSHSINWDLLEDQYLSDGEYREKLSKMVTIVDEAFLAGKKFARTYSQTVEIPQDAPKTPQTSEKSELKRKLDITYNENGAKVPQNVIDVNKSILDLNNKVPKTEVKSETIAQIENLDEELKSLRDEGKISDALYNKLISNEKFVLEPQDIYDINNLSEKKIKEVLMRCKVGKSTLVISVSFCTGGAGRRDATC